MSKYPFFALVDCNNFYASCERVFEPRLRLKPIVVLSNNDGCIIARSQEAKDLGFAMGEPVFKCQAKIKQFDVKVFSSNFTLYGDMSRRVMDILKESWPHIEVYSIDEAFMLLDGIKPSDLFALAARIRSRIYQYTGLPVSIGIARTKTLSKVANKIAKKTKEGVFVISQEHEEKILKNYPVDDIWGIGRRYAKWLRCQGILNAFDFSRCPDEWIRTKMTVVGVRTAAELRGDPCIELEEAPPTKKGIMVSRSFGYEVTTLSELKEAVSAYTAKACEKLRRQDSVCGHLNVFIESNRFRKDCPYYSNGGSVAINPPTADTLAINRLAINLVIALYREGLYYKRAGVYLSDFSHQGSGQQYLWGSSYPGTKNQKLMTAVDSINRIHGREGVLLASEGLGKPWYMKQAQKSRRYTTNLKEILEI